jgi:chromosome segregation ATPase
MTDTSETQETQRRGRKAKHEGESDVGAEGEISATTEPSVEGAELAPSETPNAEMTPADRPSEVDPEAERRRIREQLEALERKQAELRRALAIADHPELGDAIRAIEGRVYAVSRAEAKMAQGLSKSEERRRETIEKKLTASRMKRDELNAQILELERELHELGALRTEAFEAERRETIEKLMSALSAHGAIFEAAGLELTTLIPELARYMPEVRAIAEDIVARGPS